MSRHSVKRWTRKQARDLWTAIGIVAITVIILFSLPELDAELPRSLIFGMVVLVALVVLWSRGVPLWSRRHRRSGGHQSRVS